MRRGIAGPAWVLRYSCCFGAANPGEVPLVSQGLPAEDAGLREQPSMPSKLTRAARYISPISCGVQLYILYIIFPPTLMPPGTAETGVSQAAISKSLGDIPGVVPAGAFYIGLQVWRVLL